MATFFFRLFKNSAIALIILCLYGCISVKFDTHSTGDFDSKERLKKAIADILKDSEKSENEMLNGRIGNIDNEVIDFVQRHFYKANEIVLQHTVEAEKAIPFVSFNDYLDKRKTLLAFTLKLNPTLVIVDSEFAFATAFPSGRVVLSQPLAKMLYVADGIFSNALLGILIHELVHIRDGHSIEQWATADGRNALVSDYLLGAMAKLTALIPILSIKYDIGYEQTFRSAKQLPKLSEFAADLGAVSLLEKNGFDKAEYIKFLESIYARSKTSKEVSNEPFSWMKERVDCLGLFFSTHFAEGLAGIVIGSAEDGDTIIQTHNNRLVYETITILDNPNELRRQFPILAALSDEGLRQTILLKLQGNMFTACAIQNTFSTSPIVEGVLTTPGFDLSMFTLQN